MKGCSYASKHRANEVSSHLAAKHPEQKNLKVVDNRKQYEPLVRKLVERNIMLDGKPWMEGKEKDAKTKRYYCKLCRKSINNPTHHIGCHFNATLKCPVKGCNFGTKQLGNAKRHLKLIHPEQRHLNAIDTTKDYLVEKQKLMEQHILLDGKPYRKQNEGAGIFVCRMCGKRINCRKHHAFLHLGLTPFQCPAEYCPFTFRERCNAKRHLALHHPDQKNMHIIDNCEQYEGKVRTWLEENIPVGQKCPK